MATSGSKVLRANEEPAAVPCEHCGNGVRYTKVGEVFNTYMWLLQDLCQCNGAKERREKEQEELVRQYRLEQEKEKQELIQRLFRTSQLPARFKERTFDNFKVTPENQEAYESSKRYADNFNLMKQEGQGLAYGGRVGTGKTHLAAAVALQLLNDCHSVVFGTITALLGRIRESYDEDSKYTERQVLDQLINCELLVIDDLGKENPTSWVKEKVFEIINARYEGKKPTIITTNTKLSDIETRYGENGPAIVSRIIEMCEAVRMAGEDFRKGRLD